MNVKTQILRNSPKIGRRQGFSLIATLAMCILLTILALGLLSLSSVALRNTSALQYDATARANARMALMLAIGELQKELGPDQRISARASILDSDTATDVADGVPNPHWMGVWNSWDDWMNNPALQTTYNPGRTSRFRRWLVSHPDPLAAGNPLAKNASIAGSVVMARGGGVPGATVEVPALTTAGNGRFAWWITGENQKANVAITAPEPQSQAARLHDRSHWRRANAALLAGLGKAPTNQAILARAASLPSYGLGSTDVNFPKELGKYYHDLTVDSIGLATNVRKGGLKKDLNLLLESPSLPTEFGTFSPQNPNGTIIPIRQHTGYLPNVHYSQNLNFSSWYKLRQYYQLYRSGGDETAADCMPVPFRAAGLWGTAASPSINFNWHTGNFDIFGIGRTPINARLMLVFSTSRVPGTVPNTFDYKLGVNPVVVLWNPYNVTLHSPPQRIVISPGSLEYKAYKANVEIVPWSKLKRAGGTPFAFSVFPMEGPGLTTRPIILKPGETRIFSASSAFNPTGNELYPGYTAPGANGGFEIDLNGLTGISGTPKVELAMRMNDRRTDHGDIGQEQFQMYWTADNAMNVNQRFNEVAANPVIDDKPIYLAPDSTFGRANFPAGPGRVAFGSFQFILKSGQDLRNPGTEYANFDARCKNFIHANPINQRAMYGEATPRMRAMAQYHVQVQPGTGSALDPFFDSSTNRAYTGNSVTSSGQTNVVTQEFPLVPVTSLASLMHFKLNPGDTRDGNTSRHLWDVSANQALGIGNSFAHPLIAGNQIYQDVSDAACRGTALQMQLIRDFHDHGFLNNDALWDDWFCSGITHEDRGLFQTGRSMREVVTQFRDGSAPLRNSHLVAWKTGQDPEQALLNGNNPSANAFRVAARFLMIKGAFNINSTSVEAWKAFLAGAQDEDIVSINPQTGSLVSTAVPADRAVFSRFSLPASPDEGTSATDPASWLGLRLLTNAQISRLASECVRQVKERGPFLNLSEFVNRRLANDEKGVCGALQAAIDWDEFLGRSPQAGSAESINGRFKGPDDFIGAADPTLGLNFPAAWSGSRYTGIPGYLTQADVLKRLGNMITPRDDTFRIRAYGESKDASGTVRSRHWCEAVVRRIPDYLDTSESPETARAQLTALPNRRFGRRFEVVSFRWLSPEEI